MSLRASGHHALPDDEQALMASLVQRALAIEQYESGTRPPLTHLPLCPPGPLPPLHIRV